jgi:ribonuclease PH
MEFVELQGTAEKGSFRKEEWSKMLELAEAGVKQLFELQRKTLSEWGL